MCTSSGHEMIVSIADRRLRCPVPPGHHHKDALTLKRHLMSKLTLQQSITSYSYKGTKICLRRRQSPLTAMADQKLSLESSRVLAIALKSHLHTDDLPGRQEDTIRVGRWVRITHMVAGIRRGVAKIEELALAGQWPRGGRSLRSLRRAST
ncbi:hypothetical protein FKP32DRAFT_499448 [Trametes sanguinea]|nr:hypothetical protein FKP32DRAFT_499448 [Trametes sanguinea]